MNDKKVSLITPCYNSERYMDRYFGSILALDYPAIELILVDDGSTDKTAEKMEEYRDRLEEKGIEVIYIHQENKGLPAAVGRGLEIFTGDYLKWSDADDVLSPQILSEQVSFLELHPDKGFVLCAAALVDDKDPDKVLGAYGGKVSSGRSYFTDLIMERKVACGAGVALVRREAFLDVLPTRHIYEDSEGQNWQIMLPLSYHYDTGYIDKVLFKVAVHADSSSRHKRTNEEELERFDMFERTLRVIIGSMNIPEEPQLMKTVAQRYDGKRLSKYLKMNDMANAERIYSKIKADGNLNAHIRIVYLSGKSRLVGWMMRMYRRVSNR